MHHVGHTRSVAFNGSKVRMTTRANCVRFVSPSRASVCGLTVSSATPTIEACNHNRASGCLRCQFPKTRVTLVSRQLTRAAGGSEQSPFIRQMRLVRGFNAPTGPTGRPGFAGCPRQSRVGCRLWTMPDRLRPTCQSVDQAGVVLRRRSMLLRFRRRNC